jgi:hypothetical protein
VIDLCLNIDSGLHRFGVGLWFEKGRDGDEDASWWGCGHLCFMARALKIRSCLVKLHSVSLKLLFFRTQCMGNFSQMQLPSVMIRSSLPHIPKLDRHGSPPWGAADPAPEVGLP